MNSEGIINTFINLVNKFGIYTIVLCLAVSNDFVTKLSNKFEDKVAIFITSSDFPSIYLASEITMKEWFNKYKSGFKTWNLTK